MAEQNEARSQGAKKGWKQHLLLSGVPLEYDVARILSENEMSVEADFSYLRKDGNLTKEFSVDAAATWLGPDDKLDIELSILIECKYRSPHKTILLIPEPNTVYSGVTSGGTMHFVDEHVPYYLPYGHTEAVEDGMPFAYKAVEIFESGASEHDFRHGIQQLRYAVPALIRKNLEFNLSQHLSESGAIFMSSILVTNADIRILKVGCSVSDIEKSDDISEISNKIDSAILYSDYGPDYADHFRWEMEKSKDELCDLARRRMNDIATSKQMSGGWKNTYEYIDRLCSGERYLCRSFSTQFFISSVGGLPDLIKRMKEACAAAYNGRSSEDPVSKKTVDAPSG